MAIRVTTNRTTGIAALLLATLAFAGDFTVLWRSTGYRPGPGPGTRARQRSRGMALLGWGRLEHALLAARSDRRLELRQAEGRLAVERRRLRPGRVLPHDAALRQRPAVHRRHDAPDCRGHRSRDRRDALDVADERRHPLAESPAPVRRARPLGTGPTARTSASSSPPPAITSHRSMRRRASPIRSSARTASSI